MRGLAVREGQLALVEDLLPADPGPKQVEVQIVCASVNPTDLELAAGVYDEHLRDIGRLELPRTGLEFAGVVTTPGAHFQPGDEVFGYVDLMHGDKSHQERIAIDERSIARKPTALTFPEAAALPLGAQTSLVGLRDVAAARPGERVLINGAAGGLGVYATQIAARKLGLHVTAVAGSGQSEFLKGLGAHRVHDYSQEDVGDLDETFDIVFDLTTRIQFDRAVRLLSPTGRFMPSEPLKAGVDFSSGAVSGQRSVDVWVPRGDRVVLNEVADWVKDGSLTAFVDSVYPFHDFREAFARQREHGKRGRIILNLENF